MTASPTTPADADKTTLGETDVEKLWKAFGAFDADGGGAISVDEMRDVMRSLGQTPSDTELRDLIKDVDPDLSGTIDFEAMVALEAGA